MGLAQCSRQLLADMAAVAPVKASGVGKLGP